MRTTKEICKDKGITLIALVITIIVMLILVAVTISMAVNGGLFEYAGKAVGQTKNKIDDEEKLAEGRIQVAGVWYDSIADYIAGKKSDNQDDNGEDTTGSQNIETFSEIYTENTTITEGEYKAVIPKGFAVGTSKGINKIENGLVIRDSNQNEFVWIPVKKAFITEDEIAALRSNGVTSRSNATTSRSNSETITSDLLAVQSLVNSGTLPMAVKVGENYKGLLYNFSGTTMLTAELYDWNSTETYREPANLTGTYASESYWVDARDGFVFDSQDMFSVYGLGTYTDTYYQEAYNKMVESVARNGGFYVGRYETSTGTYTDTENNSISYAQSKSKFESTKATWYDLYKYQSEYANSINGLNVKSEMIWESQWGQVMAFIHGKKDGQGNPFYVTVTGNRETFDSYIEGTDDYGYSTKNYVTGDNTVDVVSNIFDLETYKQEWTQGAYSTSSRITGGYDVEIAESEDGYGYGSYNYLYYAANRSSEQPTYNGGGRLSLYVVD